RVETSLLIRHVFRDVNSSAAVLTTERETLKYANQQEDNRRSDSDRRVGWQETDRGGGAAHNDQRYEKRILSSDEIADASKEECSERTDYKSDREGRQVGD